MASFQLPSAIFPENAVTRAEHVYQTRTARKLRTWRRWINRAVMWLAITIALIEFGGLLIASLTQRDPSPLVRSLDPLPTLLILLTVFYHLYLLFQTISLAANSISREKESQTWEMLVLTGIDARQIVRGKWWATIQRQVPRYLQVGVLRVGATAAVAISFAAIFSYQSNYYQRPFQLPHPFTILVAGLLGIALTVANLGLSAACGIMGSADSKRSTIAIVRGIANQAVISIVPVLVAAFLFARLYIVTSAPLFRSIYAVVGSTIVSLIDNGANLLATPLYPGYLFNNGNPYLPVAPISVDWMISGLLTLVCYALLIWFALWRAEKRAVSALATPVSSKTRTRMP